MLQGDYPFVMSTTLISKPERLDQIMRKMTKTMILDYLCALNKIGSVLVVRTGYSCRWLVWLSGENQKCER